MSQVQNQSLGLANNMGNVTQPPADTRNVIIFGQTGAGKSSLINLLARKDIAKVSSGVFGCTAPSHRYDISPKAGHTPYTFWDTAGLNEGEKGTVPARDAIHLLYNLVKTLRDINLVIYCVRGARFTDIVRVNYDLFWGIMCEGRVPIVLVVTGLEQESDMDQWWTNYGKDVTGMGITFEGHACVTTTKGRNNLYEQEYLRSADRVWALVQQHCPLNPLTSRAEWISEVPNRMEAYMKEYIGRTGKERKVLPKPRRPRPRPPLPSSALKHNIILFGDAGSGKSSIVNMLIGKDVSDNDTRRTFQNECYETEIGDTLFCIHDTPGLNEGDQERVPHWTAIEGLYTLIRRLDCVSLLIYCMRGRIKENAQANWILFHKVICAERVPTILVMTGLENEEDLEDGARRSDIMKAFKTYNMFPLKDVACVVSVRGKNNEFEELYSRSQTKLRSLITQSHGKSPWNTATDEWFARIYRNVYTTALCFLPRRRLEFVNTVGNVIDEFIKEANMNEDDSVKLKATLLKAEMKFLKKRYFLW